MEVHSINHAHVTVSNGLSIISNVTFSADRDPQELDLPSGAWYLWPVKQGQLTVQGILSAGSAPPALSDTAVSITVTSGDHTVTISDCYLSALTVNAAQLGDDKTAINISATYFVFLHV